MPSNKKVRAPIELTLDDDDLDLKNELSHDFAVSRIKELLPASKRRRGIHICRRKIETAAPSYWNWEPKAKLNMVP